MKTPVMISGTFLVNAIKDTGVAPETKTHRYSCSYIVFRATDYVSVGVDICVVGTSADALRVGQVYSVSGSLINDVNDDQASVFVGLSKPVLLEGADVLVSALSGSTSITSLGTVQDVWTMDAPGDRSIVWADMEHSSPDPRFGGHTDGVMRYRYVSTTIDDCDLGKFAEGNTLFVTGVISGYDAVDRVFVVTVDMVSVVAVPPQPEEEDVPTAATPDDNGSADDD